jgi:hypothetical protein
MPAAADAHVTAHACSVILAGNGRTVGLARTGTDLGAHNLESA